MTIPLRTETRDRPTQSPRAASTDTAKQCTTPGTARTSQPAIGPAHGTVSVLERLRRLLRRAIPTKTRTGTDREEGIGILDTLVAVPLLVAVGVLIVALARVRLADGLVIDAANDAARAASLQRSSGAAAAAASSAAATSLAGTNTSCQGGPAVSVDTSNWVAGGSVSVTVTCTANLSDVAVPGLPGSHTLDARATAPIERFRFQGGTP
jgi:Flp pilus assembly protein TadG